MHATPSSRASHTTGSAPPTPTTRVLAAASAATVTAATALLLAVVTAAPAFADGGARGGAGSASRVGSGDEAEFTELSPAGGVSEASVVAELEPAVIGIHQGITGSFAHVPTPTVQTPQAPPALAPPAFPAVHHAPVKEPVPRHPK